MTSTTMNCNPFKLDHQETSYHFTKIIFIAFVFICSINGGLVRQLPGCSANPYYLHIPRNICVLVNIMFAKL